MRHCLPVFLGLGLLGCAAAPATPEQRAAAEHRLLRPFADGLQVQCSDLLVEFTGNFLNNVGQPAVDVNAHTATKQRGEGFVDTVWTNRSGDRRTAFRLIIGERSDATEPGVQRGPLTTFVVANQVRLRVFEGTHPLTLNVRAGGAVAVGALGQPPANASEVVVEDGVLTVRR